MEIEDVFIEPVRGDNPSKYYAVAAVMPVLVHEKREIRSPMMYLFFVQIDGRWKYMCRQ